MSLMIMLAAGPGSMPPNWNLRPSGNDTSSVPRRSRAANVNAIRAVTGKLTKDAVQNPTSTGLAAEEAARLRMGDRVLTSGADKLGVG